MIEVKKVEDMKYLLELFLNGNFNEFLREDYEKKLTNVQYCSILQTTEEYSLETILKNLNAQNLLEQLQSEINTIDESVLYDSFIHGINHNERVLFWSYYLGLQSRIDEVEMRIVLDGAKYHDIGRTNDLLDPEHGKRSALLIDQIVNDPIYGNNQNLNLLKAIMEVHSLQDKYKEQVMRKYKLENKEQFYKLFSILKDADALDRVRLTYMKNRFSSLNPSYLRFPDSKKLLLAAHELNEFYMKNKEKLRGVNNEKFIY